MARHIKYGSEYMMLHDDGCITRPEIGMNTPSGKWKVVGAVRYNNFGHVVERYSLKQILEDPDSIPWEFKNGKQQTHIRDFDHGSIREWGCPNHCVF